MFQQVNNPASVDLTARMGVVLNTFDDLIDHGKSVLSLGYGVVDEFADATGINAGASSGHTLNVGGYYHNPSPGNVLISGAIGTAKAYDFTSGPIAAAFDGNTVGIFDGGAYPSIGGVAATDKVYLGKDWGVAGEKKIGRFKVHASTDYGLEGYGGASTGYTVYLEGSNDEAAWSELYSGAFTDSNGLVIDVASGIDTATAYRYHRIGFSHAAQASSTYVVIEVEFYEAQSEPAMVLQCADQVAAAAPVAGQFIGLLEGAVTLGADFTVALSSDGGVTFDSVTLENYGDHGSGIAVIAGDVALTGGGLVPVWKASVLAGVEVRLHAAAMLWGA